MWFITNVDMILNKMSSFILIMFNRYSYTLNNNNSVLNIIGGTQFK